MRIPDQAIDHITRVSTLPRWLLERVDVQVHPLAVGPSCGCEMQAMPRLKAIGASPKPGLIWIDPTMQQGLFTTARGLGLVAHEACHSEQWEEIPDFDLQYQVAEQERMAQGLPPWENSYERPCYAIERQVTQALRDLGILDMPKAPPVHAYNRLILL